LGDFGNLFSENAAHGMPFCVAKIISVTRPAVGDLPFSEFWAISGICSGKMQRTERPFALAKPFQ
jgi:hypothetical protein